MIRMLPKSFTANPVYLWKLVSRLTLKLAAYSFGRYEPQEIQERHANACSRRDYVHSVFCYFCLSFAMYFISGMALAMALWDAPQVIARNLSSLLFIYGALVCHERWVRLFGRVAVSKDGH